MFRITHSKNWLRWLLIAAALCVAPSVMPAQTASCTPSNSAFDTAYWAAQPPAIAALRQPGATAAQTVTLTKQAITLATQGYAIDGMIMVNQWDPCLVMSIRAGWGEPWVPSLLQSPLVITPTSNGPMVTFAGAPYNPNSPPAGSLLVSTNAASFAPYTPPAPPPPPVSAPLSCVGVAVGAGYYAAPYYLTVPACKLPNGQAYTSDPRGAFTFHLSQDPFTSTGVTYWFTSQSGN